MVPTELKGCECPNIWKLAWMVFGEEVNERVKVNFLCKKATPQRAALPKIRG
jgi:hypothetical protein